MDFTELELIALRDVWFSRQRRGGVSSDFHVRRIMREYSQKFVTPLHEVYELPIEFVVQNWLEDLYEDWKDEDLLQEVRTLSRTVEEILADRRREDANDADMWLFKKDIERSEGAAKKLEDAVKALGDAVGMFKRPMSHEEQKMGSWLTKSPELTNVKPPTGEKISIKFEDVDMEADSFGLLSDPKP